MMKRKRLVCVAAGLCVALYAAAQNETNTELYRELLHYRIQHDSTYQQLHLQSEIAAHQAEKTKLETIAAVEVGSGDTLIGLAVDSKKLSFKTAPYAGVQLPSYNNTAIRVTVPYTQNGQTVINPFTNTADTAKIQNVGAGLTVSTDIYSKNAAAQKLLRDQANYAASQAKRKEQEGAALAEKRFLTDVEKLFDSYAALLDKELRAVQAQIRFNQTAEQGYAEHSTKMRTAKLELLTAKREKQEASFALSSIFQLFLESCGRNSTEFDMTSFLTGLAASVPVQKPVDVTQFPFTSYKELVAAKHTAAENAVKRSIELSPFSLAAEAGYNFTSHTTTNATAVQNKKEHTLSAGLNMKFPGGKAYTGADIPLSNPRETVIKIGFSWNPFYIKYRNLELKNAELARQIEQLRIDDARKAYDKQLQTAKIASGKIDWQQEATADELDIYHQNVEDHTGWYEKGIISEFEYLQATLEYKKAVIRNAKAKTTIIIFNIDTTLLFE